MCFTLKYASKEAVIEEMTNFASDIWALGLIMYEILIE